MGDVHALPGTVWPPAASLNLTAEEVCEAAGGYKRPADQLRELHARGFSRAYRSKINGKVLLERAHHEAVVRGQFGTLPVNAAAARPPAQPNRAALEAHFNKKRAA